MILALILATAISSSEVGTFMDLPSWMPRSVSSADTFGSEYHANASLRITTNTLASVESIFDAYYERLYFINAAGTNDHAWTVSDFGPRAFTNMTFGSGVVNYRNGCRTVPNTMRLVEFPELNRFVGGSAFADIIEMIAPTIYKDSWEADPMYPKYVTVSSSLMPSSNNGRPQEYSWRTSIPTNYNFGACRPLFACDRDAIFNTSYRRITDEYYPVPRIFQAIDNDYYQWVVSPLIQDSLVLTNSYPNIVDLAFPPSNIGAGIFDMSYRLKPDDVDGSSSLIATLSRILASIDRTYDIPRYNPDSGEIGTGQQAARKEIQVTRSGTFTLESVDIDQMGNGTFTCESFTDQDLTTVSVSTYQTNVMTSGTIPKAGRDRARFSGTHTSISSSVLPITYSGEIGTVDDLRMNFRSGYIACEEKPYLIYHQFVKIPETDEIGLLLTVTLSTGDSVSTGVSFGVGTIEMKYDTVITLNRTATSSYTVHPNNIGVSSTRAMMPYPSPCHSAFAGQHPRAISYAAYLMYVCGKSYGIQSSCPSISADVSYAHNILSSLGSQTVYTSIDGWTATSAASISRDIYLQARSSTYTKVDDYMDMVVNGWRTPLTLCDVNESFIDSSMSGTYVDFNNGEVAFEASIGGISLESYTLYADIRASQDLESLYLLHICYVDNHGVYHVIPPDTPIGVSISLNPDNTGSGWRLSDEVTEVEPAAADGAVMPLVTTDWNWKSLRISDEQ